MEAFTLLKYWRGTGGGTGVFSSVTNTRTTNSTTVVTAVSPHSSDSESESEVEGGDDGPFFDLEFTNIDEEQVQSETNERCKISSKNEEDETELNDSENELKFALSSSSSTVNDSDSDVLISPSDDLFFKGSLVPIEPSSMLLTTTTSSEEANSKFTSSLLKSATKFRVLMLKLKKAKSEEHVKSPGQGQAFVDATTTPKLQKKKISENKFFTVKFNVDEVPIMSLFTRDNSSKAKINRSNKTIPDEACSTTTEIAGQLGAQSVQLTHSDEKKFSKDVMQKYLKKVKPLYIRVSKRYSEKVRFPVAAKAEAVAEVAEKNQKQGNIPAGLRVVKKRLGKSRSASSAVVAAAPPVVTSRRDDSLLQQHDGIQGAILHCKRSFNSSRDSESSILSRSASDASHEKSTTDSSTLEEAKVVRK